MQKAEALRCSFLSNLRAKSANSAQKGDDDAANNTILLKKTKSKPVLRISDPKSTMVRQFLNIHHLSELGLGAPVRPPMVLGNTATVVVPVLSRAESGKPLTLNMSASMESLRGERLIPDTPSMTINKGELRDALDRDDIFNNENPDFWDLLIDRVDIICNCRSEKAKELTWALGDSFKRRKALLLTDLNKFDRPPSAVPTPTPSAGGSSSARKTGTAIVAKSRRSVASSVRVNQGAAATLVSQQKAKVLMTANEITERTLAPSRNGSQYVEVYRRLINIPVIKFEAFQAIATKGISNATDGFVTGEGLRHWFDFFDKNRDGGITLDEFSQTLQEVNLRFSDEDVKSLFKLMDSAKKDNLADFEEFMDFFSGYIPHNSDRVIGQNTETQLAVIEFFRRFSRLLEEGCKDIDSCEDFFGNLKVPKRPSEVATISKEDDIKNWIAYGLSSVFTSLSRMEESSNTSKFRKMGMKHAFDDVVARFSRIFRESSVKMSTFFYHRRISIIVVLDNLVKCVMESFSRRAGGGKEIASAKKETIVKLWSSIALNSTGKVLFDELADALKKAIVDLLQVENSSNSWKKGKEVAVGSPVDAGSFKLSAPSGGVAVETPNQTDTSSLPPKNLSGDAVLDKVLTFRQSATAEVVQIPEALQVSGALSLNDAEFMGYDLDVLCRILADKLIYSSWNRLGEERPKMTKKSANEAIHLRESLSFSGFECFIKAERLQAMERSLKYLVHLQSTEGIGSVSYNVHVYLPETTSGKDNGAILIAYDPLTSAIFKMNIDTDTSMLPRGDNLEAAVIARYPHLNMQSFLAQQPHDAYALLNATRLYNPVESPMEDRAISELCNRLRLVDTGPKVKLFLSEEPKLIEEIKLMLECSDLPFFSIANELSLTFEISREFMQKALTVRKAIFGSIRKNRRLSNFLLNINPNLLVVLGVYDSDQMEVMEWGEMLAHLSEYRNPFVTVQLLPKYEKPAGIHYKKGGQKALASPKDFLFDASEDEIENHSEVDPKNPLLQKSDPDIDGGAFPEWNSKFVLPFKPPKLTSCRVLFTDIMKIIIDDSVTYVVVMVREANDKSMFMTAYNPRVATEYKLIGGPRAWQYKDINNDEKSFPFDVLYPKKSGEHRITVFSNELETCIQKSEKVLGSLQGTTMMDLDIIRLGEVGFMLPVFSKMFIIPFAGYYSPPVSVRL